MKTTSTLGVMWLLFISTLCIGQTKHELKLDLLLIGQNEYQLDYELLFGKKSGLELGIRYDLSKANLSNFDFSNLRSASFSQKAIRPSIGYKYYLSKNKSSYKGFYLGGYFDFRYLISREEAFLIQYEDITGRTPTERAKEEGVIKEITFGLQSGYKWIIRQHIIVELKTILSAEIPVGTGLPDELLYMNFDAYLKLGYRF